MQIDGRPAKGGVIVIAPGQVGAIQLPWGLFQLVFQDSPDAGRVDLSTTPPQLIFKNFGNALGAAGSITIPLQAGAFATLNLAVWTVGEGSNTTYVVHYTVG